MLACYRASGAHRHKFLIACVRCVLCIRFMCVCSYSTGRRARTQEACAPHHLHLSHRAQMPYCAVRVLSYITLVYACVCMSVCARVRARSACNKVRYDIVDCTPTVIRKRVALLARASTVRVLLTIIVRSLYV